MKVGEIWKNTEDARIKVKITSIEVDRVSKSKYIHFKVDERGQDHFLNEHYFLSGFVQDHTAGMHG